MAWLYLIVAGLFEIGWPVGLKLSQMPGRRILGFVLAVVCLGLSGVCLWFAQRTIPIGTAYAVWTGIGAVGTFLVGILFYNDPVSVLRILSATLILAGIVGLRLSHPLA
ncbi:MAG: multidrug efflux SMR transporter [Deltaproteobacteria bacterium]|nr:multidrug efflux SMR transporter [Deltaproteobacteria bacterium]